MSVRKAARRVMVSVLLLLPIAAWIGTRSIAGQAPARGFPPYKAPHTADGKPELSGIWQTLNSEANWDILEHNAQASPYPELMGAYSAEPSGPGIVEGNELPYQPWALEQKKKNFQDRMKVDIISDSRYRWAFGDPELKCYLPGIPRATYMPYPFQIFQTPEKILIIYSFRKAVRSIYLTNDYPEGPGGTWMGWSNGHFEGDTMVVDVTGFNENTWFDRAGDFHSDQLHVVERYTPISPYHMMYEATVEDPKVFTRPWKIRLPLYRRVEPNAQLMDFNCVPLVEDMLYSPLNGVKRPEESHRPSQVVR
jgi:hypothetical protein